jgi:hypothetical protein
MNHVPASRLLALVLLACVAGGVLGCEGDYRPRASGEEGAITVVVDSTRWTGELGEAIRENLGPYVTTLPTAEREFKFKQVDLDSERTYESIKDRKNIVFIAPLSDSTNEANFLRRRLSPDARNAVMNGQQAVVEKPNLWRRSQRVYFITAADEPALIQALKDQAPRVRQSFEAVTLDRMKREMFEKARQRNLEDSLMQTHGFAVNVQHDFVITQQNRTDSTGFVQLRRVLTDTWRNVMVYYVEDARPARITPEWITATRDSLSRLYQRGNVAGFVRTDYRRPLQTQEINFLDRFGYETRGLWHMVAHRDSLDADPSLGRWVEMGMGGPFINFTFYDQSTGRVYLFDATVFAPSYDKLEFIRHMEIIARTFRTRDEAASESDEAVAAN